MIGLLIRIAILLLVFIAGMYIAFQMQCTPLSEFFQMENACNESLLEDTNISMSAELNITDGG